MDNTPVAESLLGADFRLDGKDMNIMTRRHGSNPPE